MKKLLILPYFGEFNCYFKLWLISCGENKNIDWLIITDSDVQESVPNNVKIVRKTFEDLKNEFQKKFNFKISLEKPYKLCDYKQFYGYLFEEYLEDYDFWGYCDCDVIFGDIMRFLPESIFETYDKILRTGHLSFVRNTKAINELFKKYDTYKIILSSPVIYGYDESIDGYHLGFAGELLDNGYHFYQNDELVADVDFRHYPFYIVSDATKACVFLYEKGHIFRINRVDNEIMKTEMMYLHLQKRQMEIIDTLEDDSYLIYPNEIRKYNEKTLYEDSFWENALNEKNGYFDCKQEKKENLKRDVMRLIHEPKKIDSLLYRFTGHKDKNDKNNNCC